MIKYDTMAILLDHQRLNGSKLKDVHRSDAKPYIVGPAVEPLELSHDQAIIKIYGRCFPGTIEGTSGAGLLFAFSQASFTLLYEFGGNQSKLQRVNAAIIPSGLKYTLHHNGGLHVMGIAEGLMGSSINRPVGYTMAYIVNHLESGRANKLAIPQLLYGEKVASGGERLNGNKKHVVIGPSNQELSAANSNSSQDFHLHMKLTETYTTFSGMTLYYMNGKGMEKLEISPGNTVIVPPGVAHRAELHGIAPTFVTMSSKTAIREDKLILPDGSVDHESLNGSLIKAARG